MRQMRNALHKELDVVIRQQMAASSINLCISTYSPNPRNEMFEKTLIQLIKDIGCDRVVDVDERQIFSEHTLNRFDSCISRCLGEFSSTFINGVESINGFLGVMRLKITLPLTNLIMWGRTDVLNYLILHINYIHTQ